jgi:AraC family transcriptional regulator
LDIRYSISCALSIAWLSEAAKNIFSTDRRLMDIALDYGFGSQESFSRAFKRMFNVQPSQWREKGVEFSHLLMPACSKEDLCFINQRIISPPAIENRARIYLYGLMSSENGNDETSGNLFQKLHDDLLSLCIPGQRKKIIEVSTSISQDKNRRYLFLGIEEINLFRPPTPVVQFNIPAGSYASIHARNEDRMAARNYLYHTWLAGKGFIPAGYMEIVVYDHDYLQTEMSTMSVPIQPLNFSGK